MGNNTRINCKECGTTYDKMFLLKQKNPEICPMCGAPFIDLDCKEGNISHNDEPSFGDEEKILDDTENFINPDLYYYDIDGTEEDEDLREVWCQCTACRTVNTILLSKFDTIQRDYVRLKMDLDLTCCGCGKKIINKIVPRRPDGWREREIWVKDYENMPKCPICSSTKIHKISLTNKAASALTFGIFAAGHVSKTWKCDICGAKF